MSLFRKRKRRRKRRVYRSPPITTQQILAWADEFHARMGFWPRARATSGRIPGSLGENWSGVDSALRRGHRGLPGGSSLARLLAEQRGYRHPHHPPPLTISQILSWADAHHELHGEWPTFYSGPIEDATEESWGAVDWALGEGRRGLPGGSTLARLLLENREYRDHRNAPALTVSKILEWADAFHGLHGTWPTAESGSVADVPGETWRAVNAALYYGYRGLPAGFSLARILAEHRSYRHHANTPQLTVPQILAWMDAHYALHEEWPKVQSGPIADVPGETWSGVDAALKLGYRGLPGGSTLVRLIAKWRGYRYRGNAPRLTVSKILAWVDAYHARHGKLPVAQSGPITDAPGETWRIVDRALRRGLRGLRGGSTLSALLVEHRGYRPLSRAAPLNVPQILAWADAFQALHGKWPTLRSGPIADAPGETWSAVNAALVQGCRGLPRGSSLSRLLREHRKNE